MEKWRDWTRVLPTKWISIVSYLVEMKIGIPNFSEKKFKITRKETGNSRSGLSWHSFQYVLLRPKMVLWFIRLFWFDCRIRLVFEHYIMFHINIVIFEIRCFSGYVRKTKDITIFPRESVSLSADSIPSHGHSFINSFY